MIFPHSSVGINTITSIPPVLLSLISFLPSLVSSHNGICCWGCCLAHHVSLSLFNARLPFFYRATDLAPYRIIYFAIFSALDYDVFHLFETIYPLLADSSVCVCVHINVNTTAHKLLPTICLNSVKYFDKNLLFSKIFNAS